WRVELPEEHLGRLPPRGRASPSASSTSYPFRVWSFRRIGPFFCRGEAAVGEGLLLVEPAGSSNSPRNVRQIGSQTPCSSQSFSRRQQMLGEGYCRGRSFHRAPERSTHKMPSKHLRSSARLRPPAGDGFTFGDSGWIFIHCSSVSSESCRDMKRIP